MFTGIIECTGRVKTVLKEDRNFHITIESPISDELKIDQSVAHNGVCLTVVAIENGTHTVTAISETIKKSNVIDWVPGSLINLERCLKVSDRLDGHIVQGHVDSTAICGGISDDGGSYIFNFEHTTDSSNLTVEKGSICVNGVSLTVINSRESDFSVAIIPYTMEHTNFGKLLPGQRVNIEFDIIGKYIEVYMNRRN